MKFKQIIFVALLLAGCSKPDADTTGDGGKPGGQSGGDVPAWGVQPPLPVVNGVETLTQMGEEFYLNVMGNTQARMPNFPVLTTKPGYLRGFVADLSGKPLEGAYIGIRSTIGGTTGDYALTDSRGYYEINLPYGAITFYSTGYKMSYAGNEAVIGLYPADGNTDGFASETGKVKNFVLESYGLGNPAEVARQPSNPSNYYGGSIYIDYNLSYFSGTAPNGYVKLDEIMEITLTPDGPGIFGENKAFKIIKKINNNGRTTILNIPVGKYTITAKMQDGRKLKMSETGTLKHSWPGLGLKPDQTTGPSTILFTPTFQRSLNMATAGYSNWQKLSILFEPE